MLDELRRSDEYSEGSEADDEEKGEENQELPENGGEPEPPELAMIGLEGVEGQKSLEESQSEILPIEPRAVFEVRITCSTQKCEIMSGF